MDKKKKGLLFQTKKEMNTGAVLTGVGFLLYLGASALGLETAADMLAIAFALVSVWTFLSVAAGRQRDPEEVSYSLLWGVGALALLLCACAVLTVKQRLGI